MKKYKKYIVITTIIIVLVLIILSMLFINKNKKENNDDGKFKIVTSFYPIYILTANITQGANDIELVNMSSQNTGCMHDYTLTTNDMKKIEKADLFIENGLGLEKFVDKISQSNSNIKIVNASQNIINLIEENGETNPHIWTSLSNYIEQVKNVTEALVEANPENAEIYRKNAEEYLEKLSNLNLKYETELQTIKSKSVVILNEAFEYTAKSLNLDVTSIHTNHEQNTISAEVLKNVIENMKEKNIKAIIIDINDNTKNAETIANETGATIYKLDSGLTGSLSKDAYLNIMNGNLEILKTIV